MAKQSGLGDGLLVDGYDLSGDIGSLSRIGGGLAGTQDVTGINKSAVERLGLLRDGSLEYSAFFNDAASAAHPVLSTLPTADRILTYQRGTAAGSPAACLIGKQINYDPTRAADGSLTIAVSAQANGFGIEWGVQVGAATHTEADETALIDLGGATSFGLQAYLHVTAFSGTDVTLTLQGSEDDDGDPDTPANITGGAFAEITTAPQAQRIQTGCTQAIEQYLRVASTTSAGFTSVSFVVVVVPNATSVVF